ncbi:MAG: hypothetical protein Fur0018_23700 [Anaerolineales bacterium]
MSTKTALLAHLKESRQKLADLVREIPPEEKIYPAWRVKELLAHFAGWDDAVLIALRAFLNGREPVVVAPRGVDDYNARTVEERQALPLSHIIKEWQLNRELLLDLVEQIPEDKFQARVIYPWGEEGILYNLIEGQAGHDLYHWNEIRQARAAK